MHFQWRQEEHHSLVVAEEFVEEGRKHCIVAGLVVVGVAVGEVAELGHTRCIVAVLMGAGYLRLQWQSMDLLENLVIKLATAGSDGIYSECCMIVALSKLASRTKT